MKVLEVGLPIVAPAAMADVDQAAIATLQSQQNCSAEEGLAVLIERAGEAIAAQARQMLGSCYGKRVLVLVGKGNNGKDGKSAARRLSFWGAQVIFVDAVAEEGAEAGVGEGAEVGVGFDLIIDAAYGTGLSRLHVLPAGLASLADVSAESPEAIPSAQSPRPPILAVDIPSGVHGVTGEVLGEALKADRTITFGAHKPGQLFGAGRELCGEIQVANIGLDVSSSTIRLLTTQDLQDLLPQRNPQAHKWNAACWAIGGSSGMTGALSLTAQAAYRAGAGYVRVSSPGTAVASFNVKPSRGVTSRGAAFQGKSFRAERLQIEPTEAVGYSLPAGNWAPYILDTLRQSPKFHSLMIGPGLAPSRPNQDSLNQLVRNLNQLLGKTEPSPVGSPAPKGLKTLILDGGALEALSKNQKLRLNPNVILTPHDKEFEYLTGQRPGKDRIAACGNLASELNAIVLLKGATTVVCHPDGQALLSSAGDERLATAGTGDVLTGVIGALAAQGLDAFLAAGLAAELHGKASRLGAVRGMTASDLPALISQFSSDLLSGRSAASSD